jgi:hypothetical protein
MVAFDQPTTDAKLLADAERNHTAWSNALAALNVEASPRSQRTPRSKTR